MRRLIIAGVSVAIGVILVASALESPVTRDIARTTVGTLRDFPWPNDTYRFERGTAESQGLDGSRIDDLSDALLEEGTKAFLILSDGKIVHERYGRYFGARAQHYSASLAKALAGSMALLVAIDDGRIKLEDPAWHFISEWRDDPLRSEIEVEDLVNHSSGIEDSSERDRSDPHGDDWKSAWWQYPARRLEIALSVAPVRFSPGTSTSYSDPAFVALSYVLAASLRDAPIADIDELLRTRIMEPLGVPQTHWRISYGTHFRRDGLNLYLLNGGGRYTARAAARLGQLIVQRGQWNGTTILSTQLIDSLVGGDLATRGARRPEWKPVPVIGWWSNADQTWPHLPKDTLVGAGAGHQVVVAIPSRGIVVVRQGNSLGGSQWGKGYWYALDKSLLRPLAEILRS